MYVVKEHHEEKSLAKSLGLVSLLFFFFSSALVLNPI